MIQMFTLMWPVGGHSVAVSLVWGQKLVNFQVMVFRISFVGMRPLKMMAWFVFVLVIGRLLYQPESITLRGLFEVEFLKLLVQQAGCSVVAQCDMWLRYVVFWSLCYVGSLGAPTVLLINRSVCDYFCHES